MQEVPGRILPFRHRELMGQLIHTDYDRAGRIRGGMLDHPVPVSTRYGDLIPAYSNPDGRKRYRNAVEFYPDGSLRSIYLQDAARIVTEAGSLQAELMTFYENGTARRLFSRYGRLDGFWGVEEEAKLAEDVVLLAGEREYPCRPQCVLFYPDGGLRSITIWPGDQIRVETKYGPITSGLGVEFYESGALRSIEAEPGTELETPWGRIRPFNPSADRMHAENASLKFREDGTLQSLRILGKTRYFR